MRSTLALIIWVVGAWVISFSQVGTLSAEPTIAPVAGTVAEKMAKHLFQDSGFPVVVRKEQTLGDCKALNTNEHSWVAHEGNVVTEFLYSTQAICVTVFTGAQKNGGIHLNSASFETIFGSLPEGEFSVRQRMGFRFSNDPLAPPSREALELFFVRVPRPVNLQRAGSLAAAMRDVESTETSTAFSGAVINAYPGAKPGENSTVLEPRADPNAKASSVEDSGGGQPWVQARNAGIGTAGLLGIGVAIWLCFRFFVRARQAAASVPVVAPENAVPEDSRPVDLHQRGAISFPVRNGQDRKVVMEIDVLFLDLAKKGGVQKRELDFITKQAQKIHTLAVKENLPALKMVREYLTEQVKEALKNNHAEFAK